MSKIIALEKQIELNIVNIMISVSILNYIIFITKDDELYYWSNKSNH